jgi:hypothetical protein
MHMWVWGVVGVVGGGGCGCVVYTPHLSARTQFLCLNIEKAKKIDNLLSW